MALDLDSNLALKLSGTPIFSGTDFSPNKAKDSKQRRYREMARGINVTSYSTLEALYECPRKFQLNKYKSAERFKVAVSWEETNEHFAYGRAFETGIQSTLLGKSWNQIWYDMFMAWDLPLDYKPEKNNKSFTQCVIAIEKFQTIAPILFGEWEVFNFIDKETGETKPAAELSMLVDMENGYYFMGHMDLCLRHKTSGRLRVLEIKTTGNRQQQEAHYKNSPQATGYSIILDEIADSLDVVSDYDVFYLCYVTTLDDFKYWEFPKFRSNRADWLNTLFFDIQQVDNYRTHLFFPKRGNNCVSRFGYVCEYFGLCDLAQGADFVAVEDAEILSYDWNFQFKISKIISTQRNLIDNPR